MPNKELRTALAIVVLGACFTAAAQQEPQEPELEPETRPQAEPELAPETRSQAEPELEPETRSQAEPERETRPEAENRPERRAQAVPDSQPETQPERQPETQPERQARAEPGAQAAPQSRPERSPGRQSDAEPATEPEPEPEASVVSIGSFELDGDTGSVSLRDIAMSGPSWRLEARAGTAQDEELKGEVVLSGVRFEVEGTALETPSAVFNFDENQMLRWAQLAGGVQFVLDDATFTADSVTFTFANGEPATAELVGSPATFADRSTDREKGPVRVTAEKLVYDYGERVLQMLGRVDLSRANERRTQYWTACDLILELETQSISTGKTDCEQRTVWRSVPTPQDDPAGAGGP